MDRTHIKTSTDTIGVVIDRHAERDTGSVMTGRQVTKQANSKEDKQKLNSELS